MESLSGTTGDRIPVAVVTGGGRGIGAATCEALADAGMAVAVLARTRTEIDATVARIRSKGGTAAAFQVDATDDGQVLDVVNAINDQLGPIEVLVNAAGGGSAVGPVWESTPQEWWSEIELNLKTAYLFSRNILPGMIDRSRGCIVNITSYYGYHPHPYRSGYSCSKAAVITLTECLSASVRDQGITCFAIDPALVRTTLVETNSASERGRVWMPEYAGYKDEDYTPASDVADFIVRLTSGAADSLTGRCLRVHSDLDALTAHIDEIEQRELYALRMTKLEGVVEAPPVAKVGQ